jgi:D-erythro-7,8-dihydroneopterin triphosphate epimerase
MDRIVVSDLVCRSVVGVEEWERRERQDVLVSLSLTVDLTPAGKSDRIEDALDYAKLKKRVLAETEASSFHLIEALAERVATICLEDERVQEAQVRVEKPGALRFARTVAVEITRGR